ncbi:MAG: endonuclease/exonuclease/phosphatase family protein [Bacteriovoracaceae bacterium]|nr:endonuclease/exonuclease/phosphatase family protein [Bacteriovoracaceae bacterium]
MLLAKNMNSFIKLKFVAILFAVFLSSHNIEASRFLIPKDNNVIEVINQVESIDYIIPRDDIKVFVWNMYKGGKETWPEDFKRLIHGKDILLLQEVLTVPQMTQEIMKDVGRTYYLATSFIDKKRNFARTGVATASQYEPVRVGWQRSYYREPVIKTPKMVGVVEYDLSGTDKNLLTLNIHAINFVSTRKLKHMVKAALDEASRHDGPVVFGGDFNTWSKKKLRMLSSLMSSYGYKEVAFSQDGRMKTFGNILDHIYVRDLKVKKSVVYNSVEGSDHKAMEVHLAF